MFEEVFLENLDRLKFDASVAGCQFFFQNKASRANISMAEKPGKCKRPRVPPLLVQNDCDSTRREQTTVRFTKTISAV